MFSFIKILLVLFPVAIYFAILYIFKKYDCSPNKEKLSGFDVARKVLNKDVYKEEVIIEKNGDLTDCYDLDRETIKLSSKVYHNDSITSYAVASFISNKYIYDKNSKYKKYKIYADKIVNYLMGTSYLFVATGFLFKVNPFTSFGTALLVIVYCYFIYLSYINFRILNNIKMKENIDDKKYVYYLMIFFEFRKFIVIIVDFVNMLFYKTEK